MNPPLKWHDFLTLILTDFFSGSPYDVESEVDLLSQKQFLDNVVIHKREGPFLRPLPDGMTELADYNLISFKSHQDTFEEWTLEELLAHYVAYRKLKSPSHQHLLPKEQFKLFGLSARFPTEMAKRVQFQPVQPGVYDRIGDLKPIRLIVLNELPMEQHNAMLQLLSAKENQLRYACQEYRQYNKDSSSLIQQLVDLYQQEGVKMTITMAELKKQVRAEVLESLTPEETIDITKKAPVEVRLEGVPVEKRLEGVPVEKRLEGVPAEERLKGLPAEEVFKAFPREEIEKYIKRLNEKSSESGDAGA